jgi:hypothetical protein
MFISLGIPLSADFHFHSGEVIMVSKILMQAYQLLKGIVFGRLKWGLSLIL